MLPIFPAIILKKGAKIPFFFESYSVIQHTTQEALEKNVFKDCFLLDSKGRLFEVERVSFVKKLYIFGFHPFYRGIQVLADFKFCYKKSLTIDEIIDYLFESYTDNDFFGETGAKIYQIKAVFKNYDNIKEIFYFFR